MRYYIIRPTEDGQISRYFGTLADIGTAKAAACREMQDGDTLAGYGEDKIADLFEEWSDNGGQCWDYPVTIENADETWTMHGVREKTDTAVYAPYDIAEMIIDRLDYIEAHPESLDDEDGEDADIYAEIYHDIALGAIRNHESYTWYVMEEFVGELEDLYPSEARTDEWRDEQGTFRGKNWTAAEAEEYAADILARLFEEEQDYRWRNAQ